MKDNLRFVTLYPMCPNIGLAKDVGQIPYTLAKDFNIDAHLVSSMIDMAGSNIDETKVLHLEHYPLILSSAGITGSLYILRNAKKIDWLNIYHCGRKAYYWTKLYKLLNPKGKVYLKLDLDFRSCDIFDSQEKKRKAFVKIIKIMDLVSVESSAIKERIEPYVGHNIKLISNGYQNVDESALKYTKKKNLFLTVGRLGTKQKATEILLEAFAKSANQHDWNLELIGSVEPEFIPHIKNFFIEHPELKSRVLFRDFINTRKDLIQEYRKAKVFVLPSRWESFGLVVPEALSCGCRIIISDQVPAKLEMTCNGKYGKIIPVDNINALAEALRAEAAETYTDEMTSEIEKYAAENYSWKKICKALLEYMQDVEYLCGDGV